MREALWAYRKYVADHGEELKLPGLEEFSNEQLYYVSYANVSRYVINSLSTKMTQRLFEEVV